MEDASESPAPRRLDIRFVGSGSEYFRIWIVNLLLTLLTLGLYYPFAKVRRLRYFQGATEVGGHPLAFHGDPWKMLRGYLIVGLLLLVYTAAGYFSAHAGAVAALLIALLWPTLWHMALRFRLANSSWRGLRFAFTGSRRGAYRAMLPIGLVGAGTAALGLLAPEGEDSLWVAVLGLLWLLAMLAVPGLLWAIKRYQHNHYRLAAEHSRFEVRLTSAYGLVLRSVGTLLLFAVLVPLLVIGIALLLSLPGPGDWLPGRGGRSLLGLAPALVAFLLLQVVLGSYLQARTQNLIWNGTRSQHLRFESRLRFRSLLWLNARNWLLMVLTLGLYFPFARVATARLRLQAVAVLSQVDPDTLFDAATTAGADASGDAAADLFGIDLGL